MHVSTVKHSYASVTDGQTDRQTTDKVIPMCRYASQATQKQENGCIGKEKSHPYVVLCFYGATKIIVIAFTLYDLPY